ncbi:OmpH family outer membrane protein [Haliovirga abyssi]|uniref:OmpH family outer membrane protein n=1 Tax=Haliovirga abyssi TaxID=2996794 RepID=A0AAU9DY31_9FUSO|nr:OmpH family outer membrane protein [Haliovirga abyssi]BDU50315.1 hypothetical protein HLVA_08840 [Haliovirga abyssi]
MKKIAVVISSLLISASIFAGGLGKVDTQKVLSKYPETQRTQQFLQSQKEKMQKDLDAGKEKVANYQKELEQKGDKATKEEKDKLDKMKSEFAKNYKGMQSSLDQLQYTMYEKLKSDINLAIKQVAKKDQLDAIFDSAVVYYGATDVTDDVIKFLSGVEKIDLSK